LSAGEEKVTDSLVIPANVTISVDPGSFISVSKGAVLTIQGNIQAGNYPIFAGEGEVSFVGNRYLSSAEARWWGAQGDGETDDTRSLTAAIHAIASATPNKISLHLPSQTFRVCNLHLSDPKTRGCPVMSECSAPARIYSDGGGTFFGATLKATQECGRSKQDYVASLNSVSSTTLESIRIDGNSSDGMAGTGASCLDARYLATGVTTAAATHNTYTNIRLSNCLDSRNGYGGLFDGNEDSHYSDIIVEGGGLSRTGQAVGFRYLDPPGFPGVIENLKIYNDDIAQVNTQNVNLVNVLLTGGLVIGSDVQAAGNNLVTITEAQIQANKGTGIVVNFLKSPDSGYASENFTCIGCFLAPNGLSKGQAIFSGTLLSGAEIIGGRINIGSGEMFTRLSNSLVGFPPVLDFRQTTITGGRPLSSEGVAVTEENTNDGGRTYSTGPRASAPVRSH
jgi:hypothetical protein